MKERLYIVTGSMGHLGNMLVRELLHSGEKVRGLSLPSENQLEFGSPLFTAVLGDVVDPDSLEALFADTEGCDVILIHAAGIVTIASKYQQKVYDVNVTGTKNILEKSIEHHIKKFIYISSVHAIPELPKGQVISETDTFSPDAVHGLYAKTKAEATQLVLDAARSGRIDAVVIHPAGILGPGDHGHSHTCQLVIDYMNGSLTAGVKGGYDFVDVRDVVNGIVSCAEKGRSGECYICSGRYVSVKDLLDTLHSVTGKKRVRTYLPLWFARLTAPLSELYYRIRKQPPLYTSYSLFTLETNALFSHDKATRELGYTARPLRDTLYDTVEWLNTHGRLKQKKIKAKKKALA